MITQFAEQSTTKYFPGTKNGLFYSDIDYDSLEERKTGILPNEPISSKLVNTVLRQSTFAYIILQNTIKAVVQKAESLWTDTKIEKALSCDNTSTETNYTYSDLITKFISELKQIQQIQDTTYSSAQQIQKAKTVKNYYSGSSLATLLNTTLANKISSTDSSISTKITTLNTSVINLQNNITSLTNNIPVYYASDYNKNYTSSNSINKRFSDIETAITALQGNNINGN